MAIDTVEKKPLAGNSLCPMALRLTPSTVLEIDRLSHGRINLLGCYSLFKLCRYISRNVFPCINRLTILFLNEGGREQEPAIALEMFREMGEDILERTCKEIEVLIKAFEFDGVMDWECESFMNIRGITFDLPDKIREAITVGGGLEPLGEVNEMMKRLIGLNGIYLHLKRKLIEYRQEAKRRITNSNPHCEDLLCTRIKSKSEIMKSDPIKG